MTGCSDSVKDDWWSPEGSFFMLHKINSLRFEYFSGKAKENSGGLSGKRVLDIGCGGGLLSERFAESGAIVTGLDIAASAIDAAKGHAEKTGLKIDYRLSTLPEFAQNNPERFDCVVCSEVLEHVDDLADFIKTAASMLKEEGLFLFSTINRTLKARFLTVFVAEDILRMIPRGTHDYRRFIRPSRIAELLRQNSIEIEDIKGMSLDVAGFGFRISRDTSVNYLGCGIKR